MDFDIITFGSAVVDVFVNTEVNEKDKHICYPVGEKILIKELKFDIGGGGTNTSVAFSRLGFRTGCICSVGKDNAGHEILDLLKKENIKFLGKIDEKNSSGYSIILDSRGGERTILTYKGVNDEINFKDISWILKKNSTRWLYYSSLLGKSLISQKKLAFNLYKKKVKIAFNPSSYLIKKENLSDLLKICEVLIVNYEEALDLYKKNNCKGGVLEGLGSLGTKTIVITNKDKNVLCLDNGKTYSITPHKKTKVVERTGAGDAFAAGFVAAKILNWKTEKCLELGLKESENVLSFWGAKNRLLRLKLSKAK